MPNDISSILAICPNLRPATELQYQEGIPVPNSDAVEKFQAAMSKSENTQVQFTEDVNLLQLVSLPKAEHSADSIAIKQTQIPGEQQVVNTVISNVQDDRPNNAVHFSVKEVPSPKDHISAFTPQTQIQNDKADSYTLPQSSQTQAITSPAIHDEPFVTKATQSQSVITVSKTQIDFANNFTPNLETDKLPTPASANNKSTTQFVSPEKLPSDIASVTAEQPKVQMAVAAQQTANAVPEIEKHPIDQVVFEDSTPVFEKPPFEQAKVDTTTSAKAKNTETQATAVANQAPDAAPVMGKQPETPATAVANQAPDAAPVMGKQPETKATAVANQAPDAAPVMDKQPETQATAVANQAPVAAPVMGKQPETPATAVANQAPDAAPVMDKQPETQATAVANQAPDAAPVMDKQPETQATAVVNQAPDAAPVMGKQPETQAVSIANSTMASNDLLQAEEISEVPNSINPNKGIEELSQANKKPAPASITSENNINPRQYPEQIEVKTIQQSTAISQIEYEEPETVVQSPKEANILQKLSAKGKTLSGINRTRNEMPEENIKSSNTSPANIVLQGTPQIQPSQTISTITSVKLDTENTISQASARTAELNAAVESVCAAIEVTRSQAGNSKAIRLQLKPEVLDGAEIHIEAKGKELTVTFQPTTLTSSQLIEQNLSRLEQHLAQHVHAYHIAVAIKKGKQTYERI